MKTTVIFVEQVLIGFLVLLVVGLMFADVLVPLIPDPSQGVLGELTTAGVFVGVAYLIGIVYDRFADTLLQDVEQYNRLDHACRWLTREEPHDLPPQLDDDPFPENTLRKLARGGKDADYHDYLRSRIRLTRAMTTLIPALSLALLMLLVKGFTPAVVWLTVAWGTLLSYALAFMIKLSLPPYKPDGDQHSRWLIVASPPKTNARCGKVLEYLSEHARKNAKWDRRSLRWPLDLILLAGLAILTSLGVCLVLASSVGLAYLLVTAAGLALTLLVAWSWWRITKTFFSLLDDYRDELSGDRGVGLPKEADKLVN